MTLIAGRRFEDWQTFARHDDCLDLMVPSDVRCILMEIARLRAALHDIADFEQDVYVSDKSAISYMRETAKSALAIEQFDAQKQER